MNTAATKDLFNIAQALEQLGIKQNNYGASTGLNHIETKGEKIDSYSPADGKLIGSVNAATKEDYETLVKKAEIAYKSWKLCDKWEKSSVNTSLHWENWFHMKWGKVIKKD